MEADWVRTQLPPGSGSTVDVGCGAGSLFQVFGMKRVVGVDNCAEGLEHTRRQFPSVPVVCADASNLPFASDSLDVVTAQHVVEHLPAYGQACRDWLRVLRPGGVLLLLTPNAWFRDPAVFADETHVHIFNRDDLREVLTRAGFSVLDMRTIGLPWFRHYRRIPSGWRLRKFVTRRARRLSALPHWRWRGQTLCCAAQKESHGCSDPVV